MTPEQKWRAEVLNYLDGINIWVGEDEPNEYIIKTLEDERSQIDYLLMEYLINVKHDTTNQTNS